MAVAIYTYQGGVRVGRPTGNTRPFVQVLAGFGQGSGSGRGVLAARGFTSVYEVEFSDSGPGGSFDGGVDIAVSERAALRIMGGYRRFLDGNQIRVAAGAVVSF